ncbi:HypC/HybG/HupF family hydrogenase formation chaperone [Kribbella sp. NPDC050459]|uniref:HypC/HybG/HupF family hydrogenase formation chaperone n=1 Tax=Kribbella sp. NPDC050459 TaxID=3155785 RepID=UPI0033C556C9
MSPAPSGLTDSGPKALLSAVDREEAGGHVRGGGEAQVCIGIVGRVVEFDAAGPAVARTGTVDTEAGRRQVCFAFLPDAAVGDVVLVHSGYAIDRVDDADGDGGGR